MSDSTYKKEDKIATFYEINLDNAMIFFSEIKPENNVFKGKRNTEHLPTNMYLKNRISKLKHPQRSYSSFVPLNDTKDMHFHIGFSFPLDIFFSHEI